MSKTIVWLPSKQINDPLLGNDILFHSSRQLPQVPIPRIWKCFLPDAAALKGSSLFVSLLSELQIYKETARHAGCKGSGTTDNPCQGPGPLIAPVPVRPLHYTTHYTHMENLRAHAAMTNDCVLKAALANQKYSLTSRHNCKFLMHIADSAVGNHYYDDPKPIFYSLWNL